MSGVRGAQNQVFAAKSSIGYFPTPKDKTSLWNSYSGHSMVSEYRFLRFEIVGLATIFFYITIMLPVAFTLLRANVRDLGTSFALVSGLFLLSVPLGYWNTSWLLMFTEISGVRRNTRFSEPLGGGSGQRPNSAHEILRRLVLAAEEQQTA